MKMSEYFNLPVENLATYERPHLSYEEQEAAIHAVNHHDALVAILTSVVESLEPLDSFDAGILLTASVLLDEINKNDK